MNAGGDLVCAGTRRKYGLALRTLLRVSQEQLSPRRPLGPLLERFSIERRPAIEVVIDLAREHEAVHERRVEKEILERFERTEPDQIAADRANQVLADLEAPALVGRVDVPHDFNVLRITDAEAIFMR